MKEKLSKLVNVYKKYGFIGFLEKIFLYIKANYFDRISLDIIFHKNKYRNMIQEMLNGDYERVIVWRSTFGYNVPLFQRPQHIANNLIKHNCLVLYEVTTMTDKVKTISKLDNGLYLINFNNIILNKILMEELNKIDKPKYLQVYSTDWRLSLSDVKGYIDSGFRFIYEYIDHISAELSGTKDLPQNIIDKYNFAMNNKDVYVVVTADLLKDDVVSHRGKKRLAFSSNGVDYDFFKQFDVDYEFEDEFVQILGQKKPIVCYYGALAKWFDYELIKKIASTNRYNVVLFGVKYDESYDYHMKDVENVYFMGSRDYKVLKNYARCVDILIIPFLINDITKSTSPVKIFEYMALHKPIVTTDMNECRKYESVLIGKNHKDFIKKLDQAYMLRDNIDYIQLLDDEALQNDWYEKALTIVNMLRKGE